ncbi:MAG: ABC transporter permease [Bacteroidales bacterium]|nr:ABC transporter permease [Bacteroidales bacterium]
MFKNYLTVAYRNLTRNKFFSFINIIGLSIGLAATILILLYVKYELSFDNFHENKDRIYRIVTKVKKADGSIMKVPTGLNEMSYLLPERVPEIIKATKIYSGDNIKVECNNNVFYNDKLYYVDSTFFDIFSFPVITGDAAKTVNTPNSIVITKDISEKYFGNKDPINEKIIINNQNYNVGAVIENVPNNSHFKFDILTPFCSIKNYSEFLKQHGFDFYIYYLVNKNINITDFKEKFTNECNKITKEKFSEEGLPESFDIISFPQPLLDIHLYSDYIFEIADHGKIQNVYVFSFLALFIILVAIINFINLITARGETRAKEVGMRKVLGAQKSDLVKQFLGESIIFSFIALIIAIGFVELFIKPFGNIVERDIVFNYNNIFFIIGLLLLSVVIGVLSGAYPAFYLSRFKPIRVLKGISSKNNGNLLKVVSVIVQFGIAIFLIASLIILNIQIHYLKNKNLGFEKENVVIIENVSEKIYKNYENIKNELLQNSSIVSVTASQSVPGTGRSVQNAYIKGNDPNTSIVINENRAQSDYLKTYEMKIVDGRCFNKDLASDSAAFILNESAVKSLGLKNPVGTEIYVWKSLGRIIGVVKDYHFVSFHKAIEPLALTYYSKRINRISIRIRPEKTDETITYLKKKFNEFDNGYNFTYSFIDKRFEKKYKSEEQTNKIIFYGSGLAIFISILGLFALTSFTVIKKTKEIGIRKVHGAPVEKIVFMLFKDLTKWVLLANIFAWPLAYYIMKAWLQNFAYSIDIKLWMFLLSGLFTLIIALITVSLLVIKKANENPIDALRYE